MEKSKFFSWFALFFFGLQAVCPSTLWASDDWAKSFKSAVGKAVGVATNNPDLGNRVSNANWRQTIATNPLGVTKTILGTTLGVAGIRHLGNTVATTSWSGTISEGVNGLGKTWEGARQQYGYAAPLAMIGTVTNPVMERLTGVQAGSTGAREWGKGVYQWTGGLFNVPMVVVFGRSLSDTYSTRSMSSGERGQYLKDHPLEVLEYGAAIYGGAGFISGGASATVNSLNAGIKGIQAAQGAAKLVQAVSLVYGPLAAAGTPILGIGAPLGAFAYEWNKYTGTYKVGTDGRITDSFGKPQVVDGFSALVYSFGAKTEHIFSGDPNAAAFSEGMAAQSVSNNLSVLAKNMSTNPDGTRNWAGTLASIPLQAVKAPFGFAEFPISFSDNIGNAQRQGWSEGLANGSLAEGLLKSNIYSAQAIGGSALGMYSFAGDVFIVGPVNFADNLRGGNGKVLQANWLGQTVANAPGINLLGLGKYFNPVDPNKAEYPNIDYSIANAPYMFNLKSSVLGDKGKAGDTGYFAKVEALKSIVLKPVDFLTSPMNNAFARVGSIITGQGPLQVQPSELRKQPFDEGRYEELSNILADPQSKQLFLKMFDPKLYAGNTEESIAVVSSVVGNGKPGSLVALSNEGVQFYSQKEVGNLLESMNIEQTFRKMPLGTTGSMPQMIIYDPGKAASIMDKNPALIVELMPDAKTNFNNNGESTSKTEAISFMNKMSLSLNPVEGLFYGFPAESVNTYVHNPSEGRFIMKEWPELAPFLDFKVGPGDGIEVVRSATTAKIGQNTVDLFRNQLEPQSNFKGIFKIPSFLNQNSQFSFSN